MTENRQKSDRMQAAADLDRWIPALVGAILLGAIFALLVGDGPPIPVPQGDVV